MHKAAISEIFSSLQGEGPYVGERQIFIRMAGCPWRCRYCDTPGSLEARGHRTFTVEEVLDEVHRIQEKQIHRTVSITGGEPLMQADFLAALMPSLRRLGLRTYLETSGTHPGLLRRVIADCDIVAMDIKLPSAIGRGFWIEHAEFLEIAGDKAFVKLVLTADTTPEEIQRSLDLLASRRPAPTLVLQPVTPIEDLEPRLKNTASRAWIKAPSPDRLADWRDLARQRLPDVHVIPQMHPQWGLP
jgi:7-carboxy-7-deazaguanine synthase